MPQWMDRISCPFQIPRFDCFLARFQHIEKRVLNCGRFSVHLISTVRSMRLMVVAANS